MKNDKVVACLNKILEHELAGVVCYTHYALMVYGYNRIPICAWFREQAKESLIHADAVGEQITALGEHPSLKIGKLLEGNTHKINDILKESLEYEKQAAKLYHELLSLVKDESVMLEEFAREKIYEEELHVSEVEKMLKDPK